VVSRQPGEPEMSVLPKSPSLCWARGVLRPATEFRPRVGDRAFRYGDGVFATLALENGRLLDAPAHLDRLAASTESIGLPVPVAVRSPQSLCDVLRLLGTDETTSGVVRVQVSADDGGRGYGRGEDGSWELVEIHPRPAPRNLTLSVLEPDEAPVPSLPAVKSCSALAHVMCARAAARRGVAEAVRTSGGHLLEASASNLFWVADGVLCTPSASLPLYPGVTRAVVMAAAKQSGWTVRDGEFGRAALDGVGGAFLTNAVRGIEPVAEIDGVGLAWPPKLEELRTLVATIRHGAGLPVTP
jgi:branched-subunit amino acid aminotransferase/4-amino-4-deoxychorismate lyase